MKSQDPSRLVDNGFDLDRMLSNAAVAAQHRPLTDDPVVVGALLRSIEQWIEANKVEGVYGLMRQLRDHPQYKD